MFSSLPSTLICTGLPVASLPSAVHLDDPGRRVGVVEGHALHGGRFGPGIDHAGDRPCRPNADRAGDDSDCSPDPTGRSTAPSTDDRTAHRATSGNCRAPTRRSPLGEMLHASSSPSGFPSSASSGPAADEDRRSACRDRLRDDSDTGCSPGRCTRAAHRPHATGCPTPS